VGLFDSTEEHPPAKIRRYIITGLAFVLLVAGGCWYLLRYHTEKVSVNRFLHALVAGQFEEAYRIYKPSPEYSFKDFMEDWGPAGYYGPVKSYRIESAQVVKRGSQTASGVVITVEVSPFDTFPSEKDFATQNKTKEARLWVEFKDQAISAAPP
jgi:hypothetical protein